MACHVTLECPNCESISLSRSTALIQDLSSLQVTKEKNIPASQAKHVRNPSHPSANNINNNTPRYSSATPNRPPTY